MSRAETHDQHLKSGKLTRLRSSRTDKLEKGQSRVSYGDDKQTINWTYQKM